MALEGVFLHDLIRMQTRAGLASLRDCIAFKGGKLLVSFSSLCASLKFFSRN